jgi:hypothetical protein
MQSLDFNKEPTAEDCGNNKTLYENNEVIIFACYYPQMGGYSGKCIICKNKNNSCFDAYVWHDGEFPFSNETPNKIHHCDANQFVKFGNLINKKI